MRVQTIILSCFLLVFTQTCSGQLFAGYHFKFRNYTSRDGLVHNFTRKCRQDSKGFLWIITQNGLSRFDGYQFRNFQHIPGDSTSLPFNDLTDMDIDQYDRIWLAYNSGLCYYDQHQQRFERIKNAGSAVSLVYDKKSDIIWFNRQDGLYKLSLRNMAIQATLLKGYAHIPFCINIDSKQNLWIGVERNRSYRYDIAADTFHQTGSYWARSFNEDLYGDLWISTWSNGFLYDDRSKGSDFESSYELPVAPNGIGKIYEGITQSIPLTGKNILWIATHNAGIALFDREKKEFVKWIRYDPAIRNGILNDYTSSIYTDRNGNVWLCGWHGLSKVNKQEQQFQSAELHYLKTDLFNLLAGIQDDPFDKNIAWITVCGLGLIKYDKNADKVIRWYFHDFNRDYDWTWPLSFLKDPDDRLWTSTYGGLISIYKGEVQQHPVTENGSFMYPDGTLLAHDGFLWLWSERGLIQYDRYKHSYKIIRNTDSTNGNKPVNHFRQLLQWNPQTMLVTSHQGLFSVDIATHTFKALPVREVSNKFTSIERIGDHVYIGGEDGLVQYHPTTGKVKRIGEKESIINLNDGTLLQYDGKLWIYALNGLFCYDPVKDELKKFTGADGIYNTSNDRSQLFRYQDNIYIGYRMAFTRFDPAQVDINNNLAIPFITEVSVNGYDSKIAPGKHADTVLDLSSHQNTISFDYTAIDYTNTERIIFAYKLEGFDKDWIQAGSRRTVTYSQLPGGRYTFKVKACNSSGLWNEEAAVFHFYTRPALFERWWFRPLVAFIFVVVVILFARRRISRIRRREQEKTAVNKSMAELEMQLLRSQMNPHFIFNSLNSIQKYIWENKEEDAAEYLARFAKLIRAILENSRMESISLKEELEVIKLYIELEHRRSNGKFDYHIAVDEHLDIENTQIPPLLLQPFIENAIWHGMNKKQGQGHLQVTIGRKDSLLQCIVDDDGAGRSQKEVITGDSEKKSLGTEITRQRISILENRNTVDTGIRIIDKEKDGRPEGTTVIITIPLKSRSHA